eukprot:9484639-Heterocapsa_arctica.AAC.1
MAMPLRKLGWTSLESELAPRLQACRRTSWILALSPKPLYMDSTSSWSMGVMERGVVASGVHLRCAVVKELASEPCSMQAAPGRRTSRGPR